MKGRDGSKFRYRTAVLLNREPSLCLLIPLFNDLAPIMTEDDLARLVGDDAAALFGDLVAMGYLEENATPQTGTLQEEFYNLSSAQDMSLFPQFENKRTEIYNFLKNFNDWWFDNLADMGRNAVEWGLKTTEIANRIMANITAKYGSNLPQDMTGLCYSGSGDPFIHLINTNQSLDVNSVVLVGTPIKSDRQILNTNVQAVVNIFGEKDIWYFGMNTAFRRDSDPSFDGYHLFDNNPVPITEFAIELTGVGHGDYFYDPGNPRPGDDIRKKSSEFIARVTAKANSLDDLIAFINDTPGITYDSSRRKYIVNLEQVVLI